MKKIFLKHIWRGCLGHLSPVNQLFAKQCRCCIPLFRMLTRENCQHFLFQLEANPVQGVFEPGCLTVSVENTQGIFASTCLLKLHIPSGICSYVQFESSMKAALQGTKFTTVQECSSYTEIPGPCHFLFPPYSVFQNFFDILKAFFSFFFQHLIFSATFYFF